MTVQIKQISLSQSKFGYEVTLINQHQMQVSLLSYGASIQKISIPDHGHFTNIVLSLPQPTDYLKARNFFGATVGRVAGRLPGHQWQLGDQTIDLVANDGPNHKHGGLQGLDQQLFDIAAIGDNWITFVVLDSNGHNGYPGNLKLTVTYTLTDTDTLQCQLHASCDQTTLFNPTNHTYFALDGPQSTIEGLQVQVAANYYQPVTPAHLPLDGWHTTANTVFDLSQPTDLQSILTSSNSQIKQEHGFNHAWLLNQQANFAAKLSSPKTNRSVTMTTDAPAVILYTANHFNHTGLTADIGQHGGITLETQSAPLANNNWSTITLVAGESFTRTTSWHFDY